MWDFGQLRHAFRVLPPPFLVFLLFPTNLLYVNGSKPLCQVLAAIE
jgi:hypothetical protein